MRRVGIYSLMGFLASTIVLLILNLRERDYYPGGTPTPPAGPGPEDTAILGILPSIEHDGCIHTAEFSENRRWLRVRDRDGWYRLFWAGDDFYYFDDVAAFHHALGNKTACDPSGEWSIFVTYRPPSGCVRGAESRRFRFSLKVAEGRDEQAWFVARNGESWRSFVWEQVN